MKAQRILIIGSSGAGKSTLARRLSSQLGLPAWHYDQILWTPGWITRDKADQRRMFEPIIAQDRWVLDSFPIPEAGPRADVILNLEFDRVSCLLRVLKRIGSQHGQVRADMADGCPEHFWAGEFFEYIWRYPELYNPAKLRRVWHADAWEKLVRFHEPWELEAWLERAFPCHRRRGMFTPATRP